MSEVVERMARRPPNTISVTELRSRMTYDKSTGSWIRVSTSGNKNSLGPVKPKLHRDGYHYVSLNKTWYSAHRLVWLYVNGTWPTNQIDHINGIRTDNRFSNLRDVSILVNCQNRIAARSDSIIGVIGVRTTKSGKYEARIRASGERRCLGTYLTHQEAVDAYMKAKNELHPGYVTGIKRSENPPPPTEAETK